MSARSLLYRPPHSNTTLVWRSQGNHTEVLFPAAVGGCDFKSSDRILAWPQSSPRLSPQLRPVVYWLHWESQGHTWKGRSYLHPRLWRLPERGMASSSLSLLVCLLPVTAARVGSGEPAKQKRAQTFLLCNIDWVSIQEAPILRSHFIGHQPQQR